MEQTSAAWSHFVLHLKHRDLSENRAVLSHYRSFDNAVVLVQYDTVIPMPKPMSLS